MQRASHLPVIVVSWLLFGIPSRSHANDTPLIGVPRARPESVGMNSDQLKWIEDVVEESLERKRMPGCVVLIGRQRQIVYRRAFGDRQVEPEKTPMTVDTVFDLASLTKPIATATSIMQLVEQGKLSLDDTIAKHLPDFGANGKDRITVRQLLTHQGGLIPDNSIKDYYDGPKEAFRRINELKPYVEPGTRFVYTDVGFIVLAELVRKLTGKDIHEYSREAVFEPLGMSETGYLPRKELRPRAAPTEQRNEKWMRGEVHDPRAFRLGGIAGHAGLFSTADDLARYAVMMLSNGTYGGVRILKPKTVDLMTSHHQTSGGIRGLGWDIRTGYSSNRGDFFSERSFGHGGFTGTAIWMDPELDLFVIFLSNRVHPDGNGSINRLVGRIGTIAASSILDSRVRPRNKARSVLTGIDVLQRDGFRQLKGRKVGLITNHTGINRNRVSTVTLLHEAKDVNLVALFSPEHGFAGKLDVARISDAKDESTGLKIFSLYGKTRTPTDDMLQGLDTLVFDIQDIGTRFYTYISTMGNAMRAAAKHGVRFVVLDRPNPIGGLDVQGPVLDAGSESFVGYHTLPVRHGMTAGELATMFNVEFKLGLDLAVIRIDGWNREDVFDATGLPWINPSPNMRSLTQAFLYPGVGLIETTNVSVGRGTDTPFEVVGAPWIDGTKLAAELNAAGLPGVRFIPIEFTPESSKHKAQRCEGINLVITDRNSFHPLRTGFALATALRMLYPDDWQTTSYNRLLSNKHAYEAVVNGQSAAKIEAAWHSELSSFRARRRQFLLYD